MPAAGVKGNRGGKGGSRKAPEMAQFYAKLDAACLGAVEYLHEIVREARVMGLDNSDWRKDGITAAGKLIAKAPERVANADGTNLPTPILGYVPTHNSNEQSPKDA